MSAEGDGPTLIVAGTFQRAARIASLMELSPREWHYVSDGYHLRGFAVGRLVIERDWREGFRSSVRVAEIEDGIARTAAFGFVRIEAAPDA